MPTDSKHWLKPLIEAYPLGSCTPGASPHVTADAMRQMLRHSLSTSIIAEDRAGGGAHASQQLG